MLTLQGIVFIVLFRMSFCFEFSIIFHDVGCKKRIHIRDSRRLNIFNDHTLAPDQTPKQLPSSGLVPFPVTPYSTLSTCCMPFVFEIATILPLYSQLSLY